MLVSILLASAFGSSELFYHNGNGMLTLSLQRILDITILLLPNECDLFYPQLLLLTIDTLVM